MAASVVVASGLLLGLQTEALLTWAAAAALPAVTLAWVILVRDRASPVAPALAWSSGAIMLVLISDTAAASATTASPLPGASLAVHWWVGLWPVNLVGIFALLLVFPRGSRDRSKASRLITRTLPWAYAAGTALIMAEMWDVPQAAGHVSDGDGAPGPAFFLGFVLVALCLVLAIIDLSWRYVRGEPMQRRQIRWLVLAGIVVIVLLAAGWVMQYAGIPLSTAYAPFLIAILLLVPIAVTVAVLRHELIDIDWLFSAAFAWLIALLLSSGLFAVLVLGIAQSLLASPTVSVAVAAFLAALVLLPLHRVVSVGVRRIVDHDRFRAIAQVESFIADMRVGVRQPEEVEDVLRIALNDHEFRLLIREPPGGDWMRPDGRPVYPVDKAPALMLSTAADLVARIELGSDSARARHLAATLAKVAFLPIEVCRLRVSLHRALDETRASRERLAQVAAAERRRLERDLHDGIQQRIIGTGMRLRALQARFDGQDSAEIDRAVVEIQETTNELRRLAHGIRPSRLDDGLAAALRALRSTQPIPVEVYVGDLPDLDETRAATSYYLVAEAVTNAIKHAHPSRIEVRVTQCEEKLTLVIADDGDGLPENPRSPDLFCVPALADRAASIGGALSVVSEAGGGTTVTAVIPCGC